jgi:hypothetical protein
MHCDLMHRHSDTKLVPEIPSNTLTVKNLTEKSMIYFNFSMDLPNTRHEYYSVYPVFPVTNININFNFNKSVKCLQYNIHNND